MKKRNILGFGELMCSNTFHKKAREENGYKGNYQGGRG